MARPCINFTQAGKISSNAEIYKGIRLRKRLLKDYFLICRYFSSHDSMTQNVRNQNTNFDRKSAYNARGLKGRK